MGQCTSRKAAGAFAASATLSQKRQKKMQKNKEIQSPDDENNKKSPVLIDENRLLPGTRKPPSVCTKGVSMSFGFKRRPITAPTVSSNATAARRLATSGVDKKDRNGNENEDTEALTSNIAPTGRSTPKLAPPKKEANATSRVSRFGFRQNPTDRLNKVADLNSAQRPIEFGATVKNLSSRLTSPTGEKPQLNDNILKRPITVSRNENITNSSIGNVRGTMMDNNRNNAAIKVKVGGVPQSQMGKYTFQTTQLPRPEPIRVIETKTAKTLANNNTRSATMYHQHEETNSKDGSLTEDSGVGSHVSGYLGDYDCIPELERLDQSPTFGVRRSSHHQPRNLEIVVTGSNTFNVRDINNSNDSIESCAPPPLPQLPSAFVNDNKRCSYQNTGLVRERTAEYQRHLNLENRGRKISVTSSDGFSDDYGEEEKTFKDRFRSEKSFIKSVPHKMFLKSRTSELRETDSSPPSSDDNEWVYGGEAMADDISFSMSSSDESKDKRQDSEIHLMTASAAVIGTALQSFIAAPLTQNTKDVRSVFLTIEDPKFAAVAAASNTGSLLDDENLSPVESLISCSETEELVRKKLVYSTSNSKDINEKLTPPSPGTPTNATNSLSLSEGKDDFLIDDEIADQPALVFEDTLTNIDNNYNLSHNNSENTSTIKDSTPKPRRKISGPIEGSPLILRSRKFIRSRTGSLDTLSPCESITSDDLIMDFEMSECSGLDECDRQNSVLSFQDATCVLRGEADHPRQGRDWGLSSEKSLKSTPSRTRLLSRSRTGTPNSIPDSPRSLDSRINYRPVSRPAATSSPVKSKFSQLGSQTIGYESDTDSIRLDRTNHAAIKQDIIGIKTMLLKLRRVLNEQTDEDMLLRSETHNPFENQVLTNGLYNTFCLSENETAQNEDGISEARVELADLRRQVLFLQGQLEDKDKTVQNLQEQMIHLVTQNYHSNSAPASTVASDSQNRCNAATQTERIRPISAGPSLLNGSPIDGGSGSLVSMTEYTPVRRSRLPQSNSDPSTASKRTPSKLWRQPGEPPSPPRYSSSIPKRANSRSRTASSAT